MQQEHWNSGQKVTKQDLDRAESTTESAITERQSDNFTLGVAPDILTGMSFSVGDASTLANPSLTVGTGVGYDSNGERISISDSTIAYSTANLTTTTPNGIGGDTLTPQSTGSANVPLASGVVSLVYIAYQQTIDPNEFSIHKVTGEKLFTSALDGYNIQVVNAGAVDPTSIDIDASAPPGGPWIFLGWIDFRTGGTLSPSMFDTSLRPVYQVTGARMLATTPLADFSNVTPPANYGPDLQVTLDQHVKAIGSTAPTSKNPHGLTLQDIGFAGKTVAQHEQYLHSSGIANGNPAYTSGSSLNLKVNPQCPNLDQLLIYGLSTTEFLIINGATLASTDLFGALGTLLISFNSLPSGTYYIWVNSTTRTVEYGTTAPTILETNKFLIWTVDFNTVKGATDIGSIHFLVPPSGPCAATSNFTNLVDNRLFGNMGSPNLQVDSATDTFTVDHSVDIEGTLNVDGLITAGSGVKFPDGSTQIFAGGTVLQLVQSETVSYTVISSTIPFDDTIPGSGEGTEVLTVTITPKSASSTLLVEAEVIGGFGGGSGDQYGIISLFRDAATSATAASFMGENSANNTAPVVNIMLAKKITSGSTAATTFHLRAGENSGNFYLNGTTHASRAFGGTLTSWLRVTEIAP